MILWPDGRYLSEQQVRALGPATGDDWVAWTSRMPRRSTPAPAGPTPWRNEHVIVGPRGDWGALLPESGVAFEDGE